MIRKLLTIKFFPEEKNDINLFLARINAFGDLYKDTSLNNDNNDNSDNNYLNINIRSTNKIELGCFSFEFKGFTSETYNNYYPKQIEYKEKYVLTFCLEVKYIDFMDTIIDMFMESYKTRKGDLSIRKDKNKIFLDFKGNDDYVLKIIDFFYKFNINLNDISFLFKSNLDINKLLKMSYNELFIHLFSSIISLKFNCKNPKKLLLFLKEKALEEIVSLKNEALIERFDEDKIITDIETIILLLYFIISIKNIDLTFSENNIVPFIVKNVGVENEKVKDLAKQLFDEIKLIYSKDKNIFNYLKLDKFLVSFLIVKYKSGFSLNINSNGLTNVANELYQTK